MLGLLSKPRFRPAATAQAIAECENRLGVMLPNQYVEFLRVANGGEGFIGKNAFIQLWPVEELPAMNDSYDVETYAPGLLIFGSDGGGEAYGFDTRTKGWPVVMAPFVGMDWEHAIPMGATFTEFLQRLHDAG